MSAPERRILSNQPGWLTTKSRPLLLRCLHTAADVGLQVRRINAPRNRCDHRSRQGGVAGFCQELFTDAMATLWMTWRPTCACSVRAAAFPAHPVRGLPDVDREQGGPYHLGTPLGPGVRLGNATRRREEPRCHGLRRDTHRSLDTVPGNRQLVGGIQSMTDTLPSPPLSQPRTPRGRL